MFWVFCQSELQLTWIVYFEKVVKFKNIQFKTCKYFTAIGSVLYSLLLKSALMLQHNISINGMCLFRVQFRLASCVLNHSIRAASIKVDLDNMWVRQEVRNN